MRRWYFFILFSSRVVSVSAEYSEEEGPGYSISHASWKVIIVILLVLSSVVVLVTKGRRHSKRKGTRGKKDTAITAYLPILDASEDTVNCHGSSSRSSALLRVVQKTQFLEQQVKICRSELQELSDHLWNDKWEWEIMSATGDTKISVGMWLSAGFLQRQQLQFIWQRDAWKWVHFRDGSDRPVTCGRILTFCKRDCSLLAVQRRKKAEEQCRHRRTTLPFRTVGKGEVSFLGVRKLSANEAELLALVYEGALAHLMKAKALAEWFQVQSTRPLRYGEVISSIYTCQGNAILRYSAVQTRCMSLHLQLAQYLVRIALPMYVAYVSPYRSGASRTSQDALSWPAGGSNARSSQLGTGCSSNNAGDGPSPVLVLTYQNRTFVIHTSCDSIQSLQSNLRDRLLQSGVPVAMQYRFTYTHPTMNIPVDICVDDDFQTALSSATSTLVICAEDIHHVDSQTPPPPCTPNRHSEPNPDCPPTYITPIRPLSDPSKPSTHTTNRTPPSASPSTRISAKGTISITLRTGVFVSICKTVAISNCRSKAVTSAYIIGKRGMTSDTQFWVTMILQPNDIPSSEFAFTFDSSLHGADGSDGGWRCHRTRQQALCFSDNPKQTKPINGFSFVDMSKKIAEYNRLCLRSVSHGAKEKCTHPAQLIQVDTPDIKSACGYVLRCNICYQFGDKNAKCDFTARLDNYKLMHCSSLKHKAARSTWLDQTPTSGLSPLAERLNAIQTFIDPLQSSHPDVYNMLSIDRVTGSVTSATGMAARTFLRGNPTSFDKCFHLWPNKIIVWAAAETRKLKSNSATEPSDGLMAWLRRSGSSSDRTDE